MKKTTLITAAALFWGINMGASHVMAEAAYKGNFHNNTDTNQNFLNITSNETKSIAGVISGTGQRGHGLKIDIGVEIITVYGFGPQTFWSCVNINKPTTGEKITMETTTIIFKDGSTKTIALNMTLDGKTIDLCNADCHSFKVTYPMAHATLFG